MLDGDPFVLELQYMTVASDYLHVGTLVVGTQSKHWVLARDSGEEVATSPAGGAVVATANYVYSAGYRTGDSADGELALVRMNHDGTAETELLVTTDVPFAFAASSSAAFIQRWPDFDHFEIWVAEDGMPNVELLLDTGQQSMGWAIYREGALLALASDSQLVLRLDLDTLLFESYLSPPEPARVLGSTSDLVLLGTESALYRAHEDQLELEQIATGHVSAVVADDDTVFWLAAEKNVSVLRSMPTAGGNVVEIPLGDDLRAIRNLALAPDALYILAAGIEYSGTVWSLQRPR